MNTEDDTFNKLKKLSLEEMWRKYDEWQEEEDTSIKEIFEKMRAFGWTIDEFNKEIKRRLEL